MRVLTHVVVTLLLTVGVSAQSEPARINANLKLPYTFVAYGDTRFTDPADTGASNAQVRQEIVQKIADARPAFISVGGDISYDGQNEKDWEQYDKETDAWHKQGLIVYPALGNHDLHGDPKIALGNYFKRFPTIHESRYYSVELPNALMLVLDSSMDETAGAQGEWLKSQIGAVGESEDFVFIVLHHPPYTSSSDFIFSGGHSARRNEEALAKYLEAQQQKMRARIVVFAGHVHNYERQQHGGVVYFVTGGGGAHPYVFSRKRGDLFQGKGVYYHYIEVKVESGKLTTIMHRVEIEDGKPVWSEPDQMTIQVPAAVKAAGR